MNLFTGKLISPTNLEQSSLNLLPKSNLTLRGSNTSLLSIINSSGDSIRVCKDCKMLLNRRDQQIEDKQSKPILSQFYERMRQHMKEVERLTPLYYQMSDSLRYSYFKFTIKLIFNSIFMFSMGETNYNLKDAQELKIKLTKLAESVDSIRSVLKTSKVMFFSIE